MPSPPAFRAAVAKDPELQDLWAQAKEERPHSIFEEAIDLARQLTEGKWGKDDGTTVRARQVAIEALRTAAARLAPRAYGERAPANTIVPVQINTTLGLTPGKLPVKEQNHYEYSIAIPAPTEEPLDDLDEGLRRGPSDRA